MPDEEAFQKAASKKRKKPTGGNIEQPTSAKRRKVANKK